MKKNKKAIPKPDMFRKYSASKIQCTTTLKTWMLGAATVVSVNQTNYTKEDEIYMGKTYGKIAKWLEHSDFLNRVKDCLPLLPMEGVRLAHDATKETIKACDSLQIELPIENGIPPLRNICFHVCLTTEENHAKSYCWLVNTHQESKEYYFQIVNDFCRIKGSDGEIVSLNLFDTFIRFRISEEKGYQFIDIKELSFECGEQMKARQGKEHILPKIALCSMLKALQICLKICGVMNCKNVERIKTGYCPKVQLRNGEKKGVTFYTLKIKSKKSYSMVGRRGGKSEFENRLHLCRGHFKTFTKEHPLMGNPKLTGTYWWNPQQRGTKKKGVVVKNYEV